MYLAVGQPAKQQSPAGRGSDCRGPIGAAASYNSKNTKNTKHANDSTTTTTNDNHDNNDSHETDDDYIDLSTYAQSTY